jgi:hypothetical protein
MVDNYRTTEVDISLAYKFNVYAAEPLSRADIYVDATNGKFFWMMQLSSMQMQMER